MFSQRNNPYCELLHFCIRQNYKKNYNNKIFFTIFKKYLLTTT